jgi:hypothetical protein
MLGILLTPSSGQAWGSPTHGCLGAAHSGAAPVPVRFTFGEKKGQFAPPRPPSPEARAATGRPGMGGWVVRVVRTSQ